MFKGLEVWVWFPDRAGEVDAVEVDPAQICRVEGSGFRIWGAGCKV